MSDIDTRQLDPLSRYGLMLPSASGSARQSSPYPSLPALPQSPGNRSGTSQGLADLASIIGGFSKGEKADRLSRGDLTQGYDTLMLQAQRAEQEAENDALNKLATTDYLKSGGSNYQPASLDGGVKLPSYGFGPRAVSPEVMKGANTLEGQLLRRLGPGGSYTPAPLSSYAEPGTAEKISNWGGTIAGGLGALDLLTGGKGIGSIFGGFGSNNQAAGSAAGEAAKSGGMMSGILGKALPVAGAVPGIIGLTKDRGLGTNLMSGISSGASLGSLGGPVGSAIGAGIGGIVGALRGIGGGPDKVELEGRDSALTARAALTRNATPQQRLEAQNAGWENQTDALAMIVLRDRFGAAKAAQIMNQLHQAEKGGTAAVRNVLGSIA